MDKKKQYSIKESLDYATHIHRFPDIDKEEFEKALNNYIVSNGLDPSTALISESELADLMEPHLPLYVNYYAGRTLGDWIEHRGGDLGDDLNFLRWLGYEIDRRPYKVSISMPSVSEITEENKSELIARLSAADFNAFTRGLISCYQFAEYAKNRVAFKGPIFTGKDIKEMFLKAGAVSPSRLIKYSKGLFVCWIYKIEVESTSDFAKYNGVYKDIKKRYEENETGGMWHHSSKNFFDLLCRIANHKDQIVKLFGPVWPPETEEISHTDLALVMDPSIEKTYDDRREYGTARYVNVMARAAGICRSASHRNGPNQAAFRALYKPIVEKKFEELIGTLECVTEIIESGAPERSAYNKRKKLRTAFKDMEPDLTEEQCARFWDKYNCKMPGSLREREIADLLKEENLPCVREYTFDDLTDGKHLRFDFAVTPNTNLRIIEYDGELHFYAPESRGGQKKLLTTQEHDRIKTKYCEEHGIPLLRINYKQPIPEQNRLIREFLKETESREPHDNKQRQS